MFQIKERKREPKGPQEDKQKEIPDLGEEGGTMKKKLVDEAMKNIVCDDIVTNTTETAMRGGSTIGTNNGTTICRIMYNAMDLTNLDHIELKKRKYIGQG